MDELRLHKSLSDIMFYADCGVGDDYNFCSEDPCATCKFKFIKDEVGVIPRCNYIRTLDAVIGNGLDLFIEYVSKYPQVFEKLVKVVDEYRKDKDGL